MDNEVSVRNVDDVNKQSASIREGARQINMKILELRRLLSYICAASGKMQLIFILTGCEDVFFQI